MARILQGNIMLTGSKHRVSKHHHSLMLILAMASTKPHHHSPRPPPLSMTPSFPSIEQCRVPHLTRIECRGNVLDVRGTSRIYEYRICNGDRQVCQQPRIDTLMPTAAGAAPTPSVSWRRAQRWRPALIGRTLLSKLPVSSRLAAFVHCSTS